MLSRDEGTLQFVFSLYKLEELRTTFPNVMRVTWSVKRYRTHAFPQARTRTFFLKW
ncbi:Uncharacterized protein APZ42_017374 [Daphnia magna]|uniref:Uncharacterized protein n=1 Tax=Daphnia magna TaxID=35525 RepID=A0A164ZU86_9CRUS|nr:Uncharacterized protein APZ42_017374 [Daphnia magna]